MAAPKNPNALDKQVVFALNRIKCSGDQSGPETHEAASQVAVASCVFWRGLVAAW